MTSDELKIFEKFEYRAVIKFFFLKDLSPTEIYEDMSRTLKKTCPSYATVKNWVSSFERGKTSIQDEPRSGRPISASTQENIEKVHEMILENRRISIRIIAETLKLCKERVGKIIHEDLDMNKLSAKWIPKCLNSDQKQRRVQSSKVILSHFARNKSKFINQILTVDETWLHFFDPETKQQSMQWRHSGSPRPRKFRRQKSAGKVLATFFWDCKGIVMIDFLEKGSTINSEYYSFLLIKVKEKLKQKRPGKLRNGIQFLQDNAPAHTALQTLNTIQDIGFQVLEHPAYSPDLAPSDYFLFSYLKKMLKGKHFETNSDVIETTKAWFKAQSVDFTMKA